MNKAPLSITQKKVKALHRAELEELATQAIDILQKTILTLKTTGHEYLLSDLVMDTEDAINDREKKLGEIRDAASILNEDTCSTMEKVDIGKWVIKSPLIDVDISSDSAFDVIIQYVRELEEMVMDKTYEKDIRSAMEIALNRARENMDGNNAGRALFEKANVRVWIEVRIQNDIPRWIVDSDEKGSTLIHRSDENAIIRVISSMIAGKFRQDKKKAGEN